ncbi:MAG TPA: ABC transporter ATP-binding protein [Actinobacteria bacterium]|nr:ABC transporter ATP-binding protein [Actinomycetota bacterium]
MDFLEFKKVDFKYNGSGQLFKSIDLSISKKICTTITGPNGSGKTTLGKLMTGILEPEKGSVFLDGKDLLTVTPGHTGRKIGYLFQNPDLQIFTLSVKEELSFTHRFLGDPSENIEPKVDRMLEMFHLSGLKEKVPFNLSRGERQRLALASVMMNGPDYLILDEPTTGLDSIRKKILLGILKDQLEKGIGMSIISHDHDFIGKLSNRLIEINNGRLIEKDV